MDICLLWSDGINKIFIMVNNKREKEEVGEGVGS